MAVDVLIVGAGLSGLMAARTLREHGYSVFLLERGRDIGGRLATQHVGATGVADLGAQFFTVRSDTLQAYVDRWLAQDLVYVWGTGWSDGSVKPTFSDGHPRYVTRGGMHRLATHLGSGLNIAVDRLVTAVRETATGWQLTDSEGETHIGRGLIMTPPMPETLKLLTANAVSLQADDFADLRRIRFGPCLCGIHEIAGEVDLPAPGARQDFQSDIYWVSDNKAKGISQSTVVTSHANAKFSRQNWDASEADIIRELESAVRPYLKPPAQIRRTQVKKWRFSVPVTTHPQECLLAKDLRPLIFAGDAFGGRGRVEGAFMSGIAAGKKMAGTLATCD